MPLVIGFHPWYQIPETPRDRWKVHLPVREHFVLSPKLTPTGESKPIDFPDPTPLAGRQFDDVFGGVDSSGEFALEADGRKVSVRFGPKFPGRDRLCAAYAGSGLLRADDGPYQRLQPGARGNLQKLAEYRAWSHLDRELLDPPHGLLNSVFLVFRPGLYSLYSVRAFRDLFCIPCIPSALCADMNSGRALARRASAT